MKYLRSTKRQNLVAMGNTSNCLRARERDWLSTVLMTIMMMVMRQTNIPLKRCLRWLVWFFLENYIFTFIWFSV